MTIYSITIGLLLVFPWALAGVILLGSAATVVRRWLETCQRTGCRPRPAPHLPSIHVPGVSGR